MLLIPELVVDTQNRLTRFQTRRELLLDHKFMNPATNHQSIMTLVSWLLTNDYTSFESNTHIIATNCRSWTYLLLVSGICSIEYFLASKDLYRQAPANKIPVPWPYDRDRVGFGLSLQTFDEIVRKLETQWKTILEDYKITCNPNIATNWTVQKRSKDPRATLFLVTYDQETKNWRAAADEIFRLLSAQTEGLIVKKWFDTNREEVRLKIRVEIRNPAQMCCDSSFNIKPDTEIYNAMKLAEPLVLDQAQKIIPDTWNVISFVMRGPKDYWFIRKPTM